MHHSFHLSQFVFVLHLESQREATFSFASFHFLIAQIDSEKKDIHIFMTEYIFKWCFNSRILKVFGWPLPRRFEISENLYLSAPLFNFPTFLYPIFAILTTVLDKQYQIFANLQMKNWTSFMDNPQSKNHRTSEPITNKKDRIKKCFNDRSIA